MLPDPMLARSGPLPTRPGWSFEPKWDGFRAIVRTGRELLETLNFAGCWQLCPCFDDGGALWHAIREHQLEGVVAKRLNEPYRPGKRSWVKRKNPEWPRFEAEREAAIRERRRRG